MDLTYKHIMIKYSNGDLFSGKIQNFNSYPEKPMMYLVDVRVWNEYNDILHSQRQTQKMRKDNSYR